MLERRLAFRDRYVWYLEEDVDTAIEYPSAVDFPDQTTDTLVHVTWTQEQYTRILSALMTGAELAYPSQVQQIFYDFMKVAIGSGMTCDDVADCIETSDAVRAQIVAAALANGFSQSAGTVAPAIQTSSAQDTENMMPASASCTAGENMAIARAIVVRFDRAVSDFLDDIELITDPAEIVAELGDNVEFISWVDSAVEVGVWVQDTFADIYQASYDYDVETDIACRIFCVLQDDCQLSIDDLLGVMLDAMGDIDPPPDPSDYTALFEWIVNIDTSVGASVVAAYYWLGLQTMKFVAGILPGLTVFADIRRIINANIGTFDSTYDECTDCPSGDTPTSWWMLHKDLRKGLGAWSLGGGTLDTNGLMCFNNGGTSRAFVRLNDLGGDFALRAAGIRDQRRGSEGNGTSDTAKVSGYQNINNGGTERVIMNHTNITNNTNNSDSEAVLGANSANCASLLAIVNLSGAPVLYTNFVRMYEIVVYGACNAGNVKPAGSVYVSSVPASGSLFPS